MKKFLLFIVLSSFFSLNTSAQSCEQCKKRVIIIYDNQVDVPEPNYASLPPGEQIAAYREWTNLYYIAGGIRNRMNQDASADCFIRLCSAFFTETDSINTSIKTGIGHPNVPPAGSIARGDYIIYGLVTGGGQNYSLRLRLETANSREIVREVAVNFPAGFDPLQTGFDAASNFGTLYNTCLDFEKKKRDEGEPFAIRPKMEAVPQRAQLQKNESTEIEFTLTDCDDRPLKNRAIALSAENGSFDSQTITTDESGKGKAKFTAGDNSGTAKVEGILVYRMPTELTSLSTSEGGYAYLEIEKQPYWKVKCDYAFEEKTEFDQILETSAKIHTSSIKTNNGFIYAIIDEKSWGNGIYSTNKTISESIYGGYLETFDEKDLASANDEHTSMYSNTVKTRKCNGLAKMVGQRVSVSIGSNDRHFTFTNLVSTLKGGGQSNNLYNYCQDGQCVTNTSEDIMECESSVYQDGTHTYEVEKGNSDKSYTLVENPAAGITVTHHIHQVFTESDNKYIFEYNDNEIEEIVAANSTQISNIKEEISIEINTGTLTGVDDNKPVPENYLYQNSPNPFNPKTEIYYSLRKQGNIKLLIYDVLGQEVKVLVNSYQEAGYHSVNFDASGLNSGVYFYRLQGEGFTSVKKMLLIK